MIYKKDGKLLVTAGGLRQYCCDYMTSECAHCTDCQPASLTITPTSLVDVTCCDNPLADFSFTGLATVLNDQQIEVQHSIGCVYSKNLGGGSWGTYTTYSSTNGTCSGSVTGTDTIDELKYVLTLTATGIDIILSEALTSYPANTWREFFNGSITYGGGEDCGDTAESASNTITTCYHGSLPRPITGGSVSVNI